MIKRFCDWCSALRRGEKRVAPRGVRGRVFEKRDGTDGGHPSNMPVIVDPNRMLKPSRVWVDAEQRWYGVDEHRAKFGSG